MNIPGYTRAEWLANQDYEAYVENPVGNQLDLIEANGIKMNSHERLRNNASFVAPGHRR